MSFLVFSFLISILSIFERKVIFYFVFFSCALYYSLTYGYSYDWINYYDTYLYSEYGLINYNFLFDEPGFYYLSEFFSKLGFSFPGFLFIVTAFNYFCAYVFIRKTEQKIFAFLILFSFYGYYLYAGGYRQAIAVSLDLLAISYLLYDNSKKKFFIFFMIGVCFHYSSIVVISYVFLAKIKKSDLGKVLFYLLFLFALSFLILNNYTLLSSIPYLGDKLTAYMLQFQSSGATFSGYLLGAKSVLLYVVLFLYSLSFLKNNNSYLLPISLIIIIICRSNPVLLRFSFYFVPFFSYALTRYYSYESNFMRIKFSKLIFILSLLLISTMFYWTDAYKFASNSFGLSSDDPGQIQKLIGGKCYLLSKYMSDQVVIYRCR